MNPKRESGTAGGTASTMSGGKVSPGPGDGSDTGHDEVELLPAEPPGSLEEFAVLEFVVPVGAQPHQFLMVAAPSGQPVSVQLPANASPGAPLRMRVALPRVVRRGTMTLAAEPSPLDCSVELVRQRPCEPPSARRSPARPL